jgi:quercetin dioxygenase-like cupin family protein
VRVYAGWDGESHMEDVAVAMMPTEVFPGLPLLSVAPPIPTTSLILVSFPPEARVAGWRHPPRRQVVIFGADIEVEVSDGSVRRISAGSPVLFEDTTGKGHATRVLAEGETLALFLPLAD